jgi:hypothetical protein
MKIALTSDNHIQFLRNAKSEVLDFVDQIWSEKPDVFLNLGDLGEGQNGPHAGYKILLDNSLFVLGNHDLWRWDKLTPPDAMADTLKRLQWGIPLETSWTDNQTIHVVKDHVFVGTMGFPDFDHPDLAEYPKSHWDKNSATNDVRFMNITQGWQTYTLPLQDAFSLRLKKAFATDAKHVIVATHYPIFDEQAIHGKDDVYIWPFFFNWTIGQQVLQLAKEHPDKMVWCFAGHSHEFCSGLFTMVAENVYSYGFVTSYEILKYKIFDTEMDFNKQRELVNDPPSH